MEHVKEFFRKLDGLWAGTTCRIDDREPSIRLYCTSVAQSWTLQIRTRMSLVTGGHSEKAIAANATLSIDDMVALRDAIDAHLAEANRMRTLAAARGTDVNTAALQETVESQKR